MTFSSSGAPGDDPEFEWNAVAGKKKKKSQEFLKNPIAKFALFAFAITIEPVRYLTGFFFCVMAL